MRKTRLNYHDRLDQVSYVMKTKQKNNVTDRIGAVYSKMILNGRDLSDWVWSLTKKPDMTMK